MAISIAGNPYKFYRWTFRGSFAEGNKYASFSEIRIFDGLNGEGVDLTPGAIATCKDNYAANTGASNAIDNNLSTYYESASTDFQGGATTWFKLELTQPLVMRSFKISPNSGFPTEFPKNYSVEGSNDNTNWVTVYESFQLPTNAAVEHIRTIACHVGGFSRLEDGRPSNRVLVQNWNTGALLKVIVPDSYGNWFTNVEYGIDVLITHIGPSGYEPKSDGPITPFYW